jgi:4-aminobutyrate aminotransferase
MSGEEIVSKHRKYIFPSVANYYSNPMPVVRGEGKHVYDADGREYLDFFGGILTISVGHCHPDVNAEVKEQVDTLQHASTLYPTEPMAALPEKLARLTPGQLEKSFFTNSGTEANETAILISQLHSGSGEVLALRHSYSGRSFLAMSVTGQSSWRLGGTHVAGIKHVANAYCYRCPFGLTYPSCELRCATDVEEAIQTTTSGKIAAFIAEPIQGVGGFITPPPEYFKMVVDIVRKYGGVFICDEVQTGWGRTGDYWFGIEHWGVEPEIMTFAKGMANGAPIGATIATSEIADSIKGNTISTFGGNPVSMSAARAVIDIIERDNLKENARVVGDYLRAGLEALAQ